jgi:sialate O-acetylesterase
MPHKLICLVLLVLITLPGLLPAETTPLPLVSPIFGDNMVLQRGKPIRFWGWTKPGGSVQVKLDGRSASATAGTAGRWQAEVPAPAPGGPYTVTITGPDQTIVLHEVLVGDVWLCGGQSNMQLGLAATRHGREEITNAIHPEIRLFTVQNHVAYAPALVPVGSWKICSPQTVAEGGGFSAVAYFYGRKLQEVLHVPIGLIQDCLGGTPAESWMSPDSLKTLPDFDKPLAEIAKLHAQGGPEYGSFLMHWLDEYDTGSKGQFWAAPDVNEAGWQAITIPDGFKELGVPDQPSICWFRREFTLPNPVPTGKALLFLGSIEKMDTTYINGQWVGASSWVENPRVYFINNGVLKPGRNVLAIRVFKMKPAGGFLAKPEDLRLVLGDKTVVTLAGGWKGKLSVDARPPHPLPLTFENYPTMPGVLFAGMIHPLAPLSLRGAIWYQGEANFERAHQYQTLLPLLIQDWRNTFQQPDMPFYIVSLPAFMHRQDQPGTDGWAELRAAQSLTVQNVQHTALAVTVDTGDSDNIHPKDKEIVGDRLAWCALANTCGKHIPWAGPTFVSFNKMPGALRLQFTNTAGGLVVKGDKLGEFSVAGDDHQWHWGAAKIDGDVIVVSSSEVPNPVAARYAWQANPLATLYNGAGLPAVPFRTDNWPGVTDHAKPW